MLASTPSGNTGTTAVSPPVSPPATTAPSDGVQSATLVTAVGPDTYGAGSEGQQALQLLNAERGRCGFGLLAQNARLDTAAQAHADWQILNNQLSHTEASGTPGFTGVTPLDRVVAAGYVPGGVGEEISTLFYSGSIAGTGVFGVRALLALPYHQLGMLSGYRDVGIALRGSDQLGTTANRGPRTVQQFNLGFTRSAGRQEPAGDEVLTYPCEGTTGVFYEITNETPNPVPGRDLRASPLGPGVVVAVRSGQTLAISSARMTTLSGRTPVALRPALTRDSDPNAVLASHQAVLIPDASLMPNTSYTVNVAGTNDGAAFEKTFNFTTGAGAAR
ncbi:CAP domain-containing protein [Variovorax sp. PBS-H4]|uniref:CAP domain-containing protein n=1 Tax=Variovorax sp. PBS-H4 TaxID=434008 RepID=UPI001E53B5D7|nr:CAP domain-containing protein [Variovorax sp. PBS-H4]